MCGVAGFFDQKIENKETVINNMVSKITHRGPDDDGFYVDKFAALGMRRLSIIDLETGRQPIASADGKYVIFLNGEIYNYKELKEDLIKKGYKFKTQSDTEVILHMYEEYKEGAVVKLRGMFVFCIYDTEKKEIFIARDFFGIKPLYYLVDESKKIVAFSSEIKSFLEIPNFKKEINDEAVLNYLSFQYNPLPETFFKGVYKLPPAHYLKMNLLNNECIIEKYWSFEFKQNQGLDEQKTKQEIYDVVEDSVEHHMIADVPVGAFLSGGIDSSIITTLMQKIRGTKKIKTFTVGFTDLTEGKEAKETSDFLQTDHTEITVGPDEYFNILPTAIYHFDEPIADPSAIGLYFVAREAKKHVKVVLSGEGSDELFGGYNIYLAPIASQKLSWLPSWVIKTLLDIPYNYFGKNYLYRVNSKIENWYIGNANIFKNEEVDLIWKSKEKRKQSLSALYKKISNLSDSTKMQYIDINTWLIGDILAKADKMTMANSLELRVPFLDPVVASVANKLPDNYKWRNGVTKFLLREAFSKIIPESTRTRKKLGFPIPLRHWLKKDGDKLYKIILENEYINKKLDIEYVSKLVSEQKENKVDNSRKIYTLLVLALWYDVFINNKNKS